MQIYFRWWSLVQKRSDEILARLIWWNQQIVQEVDSIVFAIFSIPYWNSQGYTPPKASPLVRVCPAHGQEEIQLISDKHDFECPKVNGDILIYRPVHELLARSPTHTNRCCYGSIHWCECAASAAHANFLDCRFPYNLLSHHYVHLAGVCSDASDSYCHCNHYSSALWAKKCSYVCHLIFSKVLSHFITYFCNNHQSEWSNGGLNGRPSATPRTKMWVCK